MAEGSQNQSTLVDFEAEVKRLGLRQPFPSPMWQGEPFQLVARSQLKHKKRMILSMDKGQGKTSTILSIFEDEEVHQNVDGFTVLIFTTEKGMKAYVRDLDKLFGGAHEKIKLIYGNKDKRTKAWKSLGKAKYIVCTYASFLSDSGRRTTQKAKLGVARKLSESIIPDWIPKDVDAVVCDEFHRQFRSRKSATFLLFKELWKDTKYFFPISGSAVDKGPQDLWPALHLCDRKTWSTYHGYVATWCEVEENWFGQKVIIGPKMDVIDKWRAIVKHYVFHVTRDMVKGAPKKERDFLDVEMPKWQMDGYHQLAHKAFLEIEQEPGIKDFIFVRNALAKNFKLRTWLICPKAVDPSFGVGQGIEDIADDALEGGVKQYAVYTPFKAPIPHLATFLRDRGCNVWTLQGGIGLDEQELRLDAWRRSLATATPEKPSIIISTVKYAESWEIPEARYEYFLGEEYVREDNLQAEDRAVRLISVGTTFIQYARFKGTVQEDIIESLLQKAENFRAMYSNWEHLKAKLLPKKS